MKKIVILFIFGFMVVVSCDRLKNADNVIIPANHSFSIEFIDENGSRVEHFSHTSAGEFEIENSVGLFGDDFIPPEIVEMITSQIPITPEQLKRDQIYLHAEKEVDGEIFHVTLNFRFQNQDEWRTGTQDVMQYSEEFWIERFRNSWERFRSEDPSGATGLYPVPVSNFSPLPSQNVSVNYLQSGFDGISKPYFFHSLGGAVELEKVHDQFLQGLFNIELLGLPNEVYQMDEFPEELDTVKYSVAGHFTVLYGDYEDLAELRANLDGITFFFF